MSQESSTKAASPRRQSQDELIEINLGAIFTALRKQKAFIFFFTAFFTSLAAAYCYAAPPVYRATATLLIEDEKNQIIKTSDLYAGNSNDKDYFQTQFEILKSRDLARKVLDRLNLSENEEFNNDKSIIENMLLPLIQLSGVVKTADAANHLVRDIQWRLYKLNRYSYQVTGEMNDDTRTAINAFMLERNKASQANAHRAVLRELDSALSEKSLSQNTAAPKGASTIPQSKALTTPALPVVTVSDGSASRQSSGVGSAASSTASASSRYETELMAQLAEGENSGAYRDALGRLVSGLDIQDVRKTKLINISFESQSPRMAALIANAVGRVYIEDYLSTKGEETGRASEWLIERLEKLEVTLRSSEAKLQAYKTENKLVDLAGGVTRYNEQELLNMSSKLLDARRDLSGSKALYDEVQRLQAVSPEALEDLFVVQSSDIVREYRMERADVEREIDELANKYGERHPSMVDAKSRLNVISRNLNLEIARVVGTVVKDHELNQANVRSISSAVRSGKREIEQIGEKGFELSQLQRDVDANRTLYETFFNRYREMEEIRSLETKNARIADIASIPLYPIKPRKSLILAMGLLGSFAAACMIVLLREGFDDTIDTVGGIEKIEASAGIPLIGIIPKDEAHAKLGGKGPVCPSGDGSTEEGTFTESIRTICSAISLSAKGRDNKVILITSSVPDEGKSTAAINIAFEFSKSEKVLLIDADFRKPSVHSALGLSNAQGGFTNIGQEGITVSALIKKGVLGRLDILAAGKKPDNPLAVLSSRALDETIQSLKEDYDRIIIDTPPVHAVSDVLHLTGYADSVIYIVKSESTHMKLVKRGIDNLKNIEPNLLGIVISQLDIEKMKSYGGDYYSGYYDYYGYSEQT